MAPPPPKFPRHCQFSSQIAVVGALLLIAAFVPFPAALVLVLVAIGIPFYCWAKAEPSEEDSGTA